MKIESFIWTSVSVQGVWFRFWDPAPPLFSFVAQRSLLSVGFLCVRVIQQLICFLQTSQLAVFLSAAPIPLCRQAASSALLNSKHSRGRGGGVK